MSRTGRTEWRSPSHRLVAQIVRASQRLTKSADRFLRPFGVTSAQYDFLAVVGPNHGGLRQVDAGARLGVSRANVSGLVRRLIVLGLCRVNVPARDARSRMVRTTTAGARLLARVEGPWYARLHRITRQIPVSLQHRMADAAESLAPA